MARLLDEFVRIIRAFNEEGIEYAVCGGWAMAIYGSLRATIDIDLLILPDDLDRARSLAIDNGFDIEGLPLNFDQGATKIRRLSKIDQASKELITLDLLLVTEKLQPVWERRQKVQWTEGEYQVVSREGLVIMKETAGRDKDLLDLKYLRGDEDNDETSN